jgi:THUMP domain-like/RNA cap guanine-N2 methyltransferase
VTTPGQLAALLSPRGAELLDHLGHQEVTPGNALALGTRLRAQYPAGLVAAALAQHELRLAARAKFSRAMQMFFTRGGLEQASAEIVARHRATRYTSGPDGDAGGLLADLCCGIGGDLIALAAARPVRAVDRDPVHLRMAGANAAVYGVSGAVRPEQQDVQAASLAGLAAAFIDPARRAGGRRLRPAAADPPLDWCLGLAAEVPRLGIKTAPGLPRDAVPPDWELEFIAVGRELKEAVAWSPALAGPSSRATVLPGGHTLVPQPGPPVPVRPPGEFLLDPSPAVTRAGLVAELARATGGWQIDPRIAFLCTESPVRTPFARTLEVLDSAPWQQRQLPARLRRLGIGAVDIRRRGLAGDVDQLRRQLKLSGSRRATLVMTRVAGQPWALICASLPADPR